MPKKPFPPVDKNDEPPTKKANIGHWSAGLLKSMEDPELVIKTDDLVTIIKDAYPKAKFHYLILSKQNIVSLKAVKKEHLDLIKHMDKVARELISEEKHKDTEFQMGYHAEPSMSRLHMHVISTDMNSPCVKTKKHWNSFNTEFFIKSEGNSHEFFIKSEDVVTSLEKDGKVPMFSAEMCKKFMALPLKCHRCEYVPKHIPDLKKHILQHF